MKGRLLDAVPLSSLTGVAFNLSHDQTLQFKSLMLKELNFVMNYMFTLETWYSFIVLRR